MTAIVQPRASRSDMFAVSFTVNAIFALLLAVTRVIVQTRVNGGHDLFAGPLGGTWTSFFIAAIILSVASFAAAVVTQIRGE